VVKPNRAITNLNSIDKLFERARRRQNGAIPPKRDGIFGAFFFASLLLGEQKK
jgi:hypothetical protein